MMDAITIRDERELWLDIIDKAKKGKKAWEILRRFLKKYNSADQEIIFPFILIAPPL
jgi:hypothetical protein